MKKPLEIIIAAFALSLLVAGTTIVVSNWYDKHRLGPMMQELGKQIEITKIKETELANYREHKEMELAELRGMVDTAYFTIANNELEIESLQKESKEQSADISALLTAEVQDLMERYPALKAYDLAKDRLLETKDQIIFSMALKDQEKDVVIKSLEKQILAEREIGLTWKTQFENGKALLTATEKAFSVYRHAQTTKKVLWTVVGGGLGFLGGVILH